MAPGDKVMIFEDPLTMKREEGKAKLLKCLNDELGYFEGKRQELWEVQFEDGFVTTRAITIDQDK